MRVRKSRTVLKTLISVIVLLVLFIAAGLGYVYYSGQRPNQAAIVTKTEPQNNPRPLRPSKPGPNAPVSASVASLLTPVKAGSNTSITVKTTATSACSMSVTYGTLAAKDSGLAPKTADDFGNVTWSWTVDPGAPAGNWPVKVTCQFNKRSAFVQGNLQVTN